MYARARGSPIEAPAVGFRDIQNIKDLGLDYIKVILVTVKDSFNFNMPGLKIGLLFYWGTFSAKY